MLKISEFSRLTQVPAKTLRYYDEIGLFQPAHIDASTGYRHYSVEQLPRLNRILALKGLGLSLEQISELLADSLSPEQIRGMLRLKRAEILQQLEEEQTRLAYVEARLRQIECEGKMSTVYEVVLKKAEPVHVAAIRAIVPDTSQFGPVYGRLMGRLQGFIAQHKGQMTGPVISLYHDQEFTDHDISVEVAVPTDLPSAESSGDVKVYTLEAGDNMAVAVHHGSYDNLGQAYESVMRWIEANGYHVAGPGREVYLQFDPTNPAHNVTEVQFPVQKSG